MPLNYKDFYKDEPEETSRQYWGRKGAGCIFIAKRTGRILLALRSDNVEEPGTWGTWGGKIDFEETPKQAVEREVEEETGFNGNYKIAHLYTFKDGTFKYHNFAVVVPFEFTPELNWESESSGWFEYGDWPDPMHFGLRSLIQNAGYKIQRIVQAVKKEKPEVMELADAPPAHIQQVPKPATTNAPFNITNAYVVATTIWQEAKGEGRSGMQAVLNVIMNRAKGNFTNVVGIVLKPKQFSVWNGVTDPQETAMAIAKRCREQTLEGCEMFPTALTLVEKAMKGKLEDITGGATFYFNPKKVTPSWTKKLVKTKRIGNHDFYKIKPPIIKKSIKKMDEMDYPMAKGDDVIDKDYSGMIGWKGKIVWMAPDKFLRLAYPLISSVEKPESFSNLEDRMKKGLPIDPLMLKIDVNRKKVVNHEGRHRATIAKKLGIEKVPVLIWPYKYEGEDYPRVPKWTSAEHDFVDKADWEPEWVKEGKQFMLEALSPFDADDIFKDFGVPDARHLKPEELQKAYKKLVIKHHPDKHPDNVEQSTREMQMINAAYDTLKMISGEGNFRSYAHQAYRQHSQPQQRPGYNSPFTGDTAWAQAGWSGGMPFMSDIYTEDYTDLNYCKRMAWEISGRPDPSKQNEYTFWAWDGSYFRNVMSVFAISSKLHQIAKMFETWSGNNKMATFVQRYKDPMNVIYLLTLRGKDIIPPKKFEHESFNRNPGNDHSFEAWLRKNL